ncbi:MAG: hypothetical protein R3E53_02475 [Myxococcota bacterium]
MKNDMKSMYKLFVAIALSTSLLMVAASASAQVLVGYQQRIFEKWGDGSGVGGIDDGAVLRRLTMNPTATVDNPRRQPVRTTVPTSPSTGPDRHGLELLRLRHARRPRRRGPAWYGFYNSASGGVTLKQGRFVRSAR